MNKIVAIGITAGMLLSLPAATAIADVLADVKARGILKVGTKVDYPPFGFKDANGNPIGLEPDLAADIAQRLNVKLELVPVVSANRMELLRQDRIDIIVATLGVNPERAKAVGIVQPYYYAGEQSVIAPASAGLTQWSDLSGKSVCGVAGAYYNADVQQLGGKILAFKDAGEALAGLKAGKCVAFTNDSTLFAGLLRNPEWADYVTPLPGTNPKEWGIAVKLGETNFINFMSETISDWHRTGKLIELEKKWHISASPFLQAQHEAFSKPK